jgi:hypothetical protein
LYLTVLSSMSVTPFCQTISDTVNDLLKLEEGWRKNGYSVTEIPPFF